MKILAFTDIHGYDKALISLKKKVIHSQPDIILCAGDFSLFGQEDDKILKKINSFRKKVFLVHGNHESLSRINTLCKKYKFIEFIHKKIIDFNGFTFVGWGGGGFSHNDYSFETLVRKNKSKLRNKKIVLLTHAPPYNTIVDYLDHAKIHAGNKSFSKFIKEYNVVLSVSGHLHETEKLKEIKWGCLIANPGLFGRVYNL